ncbi:hypothetical protein [Sphingomonas sp. Y38-1Y]|uniref:hypothetical protein n=1 Tax=Sphingomonas sp. Y38-1Y TaxID=3078265 RepID=UPI0028ECADE9|nr:hypothetical protein [Sphingomonas sp. Y38-1Y]
MVAETASVAGSSNVGASLPQDQAAQLALDARATGSFDAPALAARLTELGAGNPGATSALQQQVEAQLTPVERGELARALDAPANDNPAPGTGPDPVQLGLDLGQMALDIAGLFDPTPISDGANGVISAGRAFGSLLSGNWGEAGGHAVNGLISGASMLPILGDTAKLGKIGKWAETVGDSVSAVAHNPALRQTLAPALEKVKGAIDAIPEGALNALPASARESLEATKRQLDDFFAAGTRNAEGARFGNAVSTDYRGTFFAANPSLEGKVVVHHAVEQQVLTRYPGVVTEGQMHSLENLRGIPNERNSELHLSQIRREWNKFYRENSTATQQQLLDKATEIDAKYGTQFNPPVR